MGVQYSYLVHAIGEVHHDKYHTIRVQLNALEFVGVMHSVDLDGYASQPLFALNVSVV